MFDLKIFRQLKNPCKLYVRTYRFLCNVDIYSPFLRFNASFKAAVKGADLIWYPHYPHALGLSIPAVITIHDVCHIADKDVRLGFFKRQLAWLFLRPAKHKNLTFDSLATQDEFTNRVGKPQKLVSIAYPGVDQCWHDAKIPVTEKDDYLLVVGNVKPHKNIKRLIYALDQAWQKRLAFPLRIVGQAEGFMHGGWEEIRPLIERNEHITFTGFLPDETLLRTMARARALLFPTLYEGFGLPALEAMAAGTPVIASSIAPVKEVCQDCAEFLTLARSIAWLKLLCE